MVTFKKKSTLKFMLTKLDSSGEARLRRRTLTFTLNGPPETITMHTEYSEHTEETTPHSGQQETKHTTTFC
jgi:hypothetical protein